MVYSFKNGLNNCERKLKQLRYWSDEIFKDVNEINNFLNAELVLGAIKLVWSKFDYISFNSLANKFRPKLINIKWNVDMLRHGWQCTDTHAEMNRDWTLNGVTFRPRDLQVAGSCPWAETNGTGGARFKTCKESPVVGYVVWHPWTLFWPKTFCIPSIPTVAPFNFPTSVHLWFGHIGVDCPCSQRSFNDSIWYLWATISSSSNLRSFPV